ncbi:hypothetical protein Hanom_Chr00s167198g01827301 [Helianthus anomalus]
MNKIVLFLIVITCSSLVSSTSCNNDDQKINMVTNTDQTLANINPVQFGRLILKPPAANCVGYWEECHWYSSWCCEGLGCGSTNHCENLDNCLPEGSSCALLSQPCCWPYHCSQANTGGTCIPW